MLPTDVTNNGNGSGHVGSLPTLAEFCTANAPAKTRPVDTLAELVRVIDQAYDELADAHAELENADASLARVRRELNRRIALKRRADARHRAHKRQETAA